MASRLNFGQRATPSTLAGLRSHGLGDALTAYILGGTGAGAPQTMAGVGLPVSVAFGGGALTSPGPQTMAGVGLPVFAAFGGGALSTPAAVPTATYSGASPAASSTQQPLSGEFRVTWTPVDNNLNPVTSVAITVNGTSRPVTVTTGLGGAKTARADAPVYAGRVNTWSSVATTADANTNTTGTLSFTARRPFGAMPGPLDLLAAYSSWVGGAADLAAVGGVATAAAADVAVLPAGAGLEAQGLVDMAVVENSAGLVNGTPELVNFLLTDPFQADLLAISALVGTLGQAHLPLGAVVEATVTAPLVPLGALVSGTFATQLLTLAALVSGHRRAQLLALAALVGRFGQSHIALSADVEGERAGVEVDVFAASTALQDAESEP